MRRRRIGFCSLWDAADPNQYSGYAYSMRRVLIEQGFEVHDIFPLELPPRPTDWVRKIAGRGMGHFYHWDREPSHLGEIKKRIERRCADHSLDLLFAPSSLPLTLVDIGIPKVFSTDQVFPSLLAGYTRPPTARYRCQGISQECQALAGADLAVLPSRWAVDAAVTACAADPRRLRQIPWGANLAVEPSTDEVDRMIGARARRRTCALVFIGREWHRKGGDVVVATVAELQRRGVPCELTVIGTKPPEPMPPGTRVIPFLDKSSADGSREFQAIMAAADLLFVPSRAEAYGQVFCEAAAFGLPVVSRRVGGIPSIIEDGVTGFLLDDPAQPTAFATLIGGLLAKREKLAQAGCAARHRFANVLNWRVFGEQLALELAN
jgi:glycosyltransferase involved in cell wall biosynthesis